MEDERIINLFFDRNEQAISEVSTKYGHYLETVSFNILKNREDTEECVNDTWIRAWNAIPPQRPAYLKAFLTKIIRNLSINRLKESQAKKRGGTEYDVALEEIQDFIADESGVEETVDGILLKEMIERFLDTLPKRQRVIFVERYFFLDPVLIVAEKNGMSESAVKTTLFRIRNRLKTYLESEGVTL
ncbi:MAG: RNA polymerase sigma factor [Lachnospiraceae bacterium]|nr:RNA polymerase sigma factor [Lachnospiraceae bacterium]